MPMNKLRLLLFFTLTIFLVLAFWGNKIYRDPSIQFLVPGGNGNWILPIKEFNLMMQGYKKNLTAFRKTVNIDQQIIRPELHIRLFKSGRLFINGYLVQEFNRQETDWKKTNVVVMDKILPGKYEFLIEVANDNGPPALLVYSEDLNIFTNKKWEAFDTKNGVWSSVKLAKERTVIDFSKKFTPAYKGLVSTLPAALLLTALYVITLYLTRRYEINIETRHIRWTLIFLYLILSAKSLYGTKPAGFDWTDHVHYIKFVSENMKLPLANDGLQMFQSPLYYIASAILLKILLLFFDSQQLLNYLTIIPLLCGLALIEICYRSSLHVFPNRPDLQKLCTLIGAFFPMNLYMSQYLGNEPIAAVFTALTVMLTFAMIKNPQLSSSLKHRFYLGASIGLALLSKATAVLIIAPLLIVYIIIQHSDSIQWQYILKNTGFIALVIITVSGWYYFKNWVVLGKPFMGGWDQARGILWWQDPGYRTIYDFLMFGYSFIHPVYAATTGFWDGIYSTIWMDGFLGGKFSYTDRPPWRYDFALSNVWWSIIPSAGIIVGMVRSVFIAEKSENLTMIFSSACLVIYFAAMLHLYLLLPIFSTVKGTYTLGLLPCYGAICTYGLSLFMKKKLLKHFINLSIFLWAAYSYIGYFPQ